uniref:Short-chain dehydrogenase/reductase family 16C member 6 n=1 Tax=Castor canadensis TaxID=51338 RepID=A0A8C0W4I7_CASCN
MTLLPTFFPNRTLLSLVNMNAMVDTAIFGGKFLYYFLESSSAAGEIVLITGAGSGLGRILALHFASHGAILVLWDINQEGNMEICRLAKEKGCIKVFAYKCDCSNRQEVYRVADQVKEVGDVTILINNTGIVTGKLFLDIPDHMVERCFNVKVISHFWTCKAFFPAMIKANHGHLVCIPSIVGVVGINVLSDYSASKFAAFGFAESLFFELNMYSFLLPLLEPKYVAQKVFNAVLEEQVYLMIPKFAYLALFLKQIISPKMMTALAEYLGVNTCMTSFKGQVKADEFQMETERKQQ